MSGYAADFARSPLLIAHNSFDSSIHCWLVLQARPKPARTFGKRPSTVPVPREVHPADSLYPASPVARPWAERFCPLHRSTLDRCVQLRVYLICFCYCLPAVACCCRLLPLSDWLRRYQLQQLGNRNFQLGSQRRQKYFQTPAPTKVAHPKSIHANTPCGQCKQKSNNPVPPDELMLHNTCGRNSKYAL